MNPIIPNIRLLMDERRRKPGDLAAECYSVNADRLGRLAAELWRDGWHGWSAQVARFALIADRAARAESK
jgi:hypothetical protein